MSKEIVKQDELDFSKDKLELIRNTICKGASNEEFEIFLELSKRYQLDPFKKQIFYIPGRSGGIMVSHAGLVHIAHSSGAWAGMKTFIVTKDGEERLLVNNPNEIAGAVCYVYRKDWKEPLIHAVSFREYFKANNSHAGAWYSMPQTMIKKVAEAGALRRAFDLGGLYIEEEMDTSYTVYDVPETTEEIKETKKTVPNAYITRLYSYIQAFAKKFDKKQEVVEKYLEKKLGKGIKDFSIEDIKRAIEILKELIKKEKEKIKPDDFEIPEITVEEPEEITKIEKDEDEMNEWMKKISETFDEISE